MVRTVCKVAVKKSEDMGAQIPLKTTNLIFVVVYSVSD